MFCYFFDGKVFFFFWKGFEFMIFLFFPFFFNSNVNQHCSVIVQLLTFFRFFQTTLYQYHSYPSEKVEESMVRLKLILFGLFSQKNPTQKVQFMEQKTNLLHQVLSLKINLNKSQGNLHVDPFFHLIIL